MANPGNFERFNRSSSGSSFPGLERGEEEDEKWVLRLGSGVLLSFAPAKVSFKCFFVNSRRVKLYSEDFSMSRGFA